MLGNKNNFKILVTKCQVGLQVGPHSSLCALWSSYYLSSCWPWCSKMELRMRSAITPGPSDICPFDFNLASWLHPTRIIELMPIIYVEDARCRQSMILCRWLGITSYLQVCPQLHSPAKEVFWFPWLWNGKVVILLCPQLIPPTVIRILIRGRKMFTQSRNHALTPLNAKYSWVFGNCSDGLDIP